jgi:hypothetical protein
MRSIMRFSKILLLLVVAAATLGLTIALSTADTGILEKAVLVALLAGCVYLAARVPTILGRLEGRLHRS